MCKSEINQDNANKKETPSPAALDLPIFVCVSIFSNWESNCEIDFSNDIEISCIERDRK